MIKVIKIIDEEELHYVMNDMIMKILRKICLTNTKNFVRYIEKRIC